MHETGITLIRLSEINDRLKQSVQFVYVNQFYAQSQIPSSLFQFTEIKPSKSQPTPGHEFGLK